MRVAGADKESLKGLKFEFVGVLPAIDREHVISLVERHAGFVPPPPPLPHLLVVGGVLMWCGGQRGADYVWSGEEYGLLCTRH